jgi:chromosomal replication initiator protein
MLNPRPNPTKSHQTETTAEPERHPREEAWANISRRLRAELGEARFTSWFARLELDELCDSTAYLSVPTRFLKSWIQAHFVDRLLAAVSCEFPDVKHISIDVRSSSRPLNARGPRSSDGVANVVADTGPRPFETVGAKPAVNHEEGRHGGAASGSEKPHKSTARDALDADPLAGSPLDKRLSFSTFLVGRSNQLAYAAAQSVAGAMPSEPLHYNPLYIHSAVGLGKTHLLQAIAHAAQTAKRRVTYLTAEKFMYVFVSALKAQNTIAFKEKLRAIDVLIIDDVQFLQGKTIQQEFCHTLNSLIDARKQIVIAADRPPGDLESLEERVRSRLAGGLCVEMGMLDDGLRVKILETKIATAKTMHPNFEAAPAVVAYVASAIQTNGRDLDGAVNRLIAHASLSGSVLCVETAEAAIRDLVRTRDPKRVKIEEIQKLVATHYNVTRADILSARRTANVVRPRQIAMYLSKVLTPRSLPEIGRRFGGRDHTTVLHAVRKIEALAGADGRLSEEIDLLKRMLVENN